MTSWFRRNRWKVVWGHADQWNIVADMNVPEDERKLIRKEGCEYRIEWNEYYNEYRLITGGHNPKTHPAYDDALMALALFNNGRHPTKEFMEQIEQWSESLNANGGVTNESTIITSKSLKSKEWKQDDQQKNLWHKNSCTYDSNTRKNADNTIT